MSSREGNDASCHQPEPTSNSLRLPVSVDRIENERCGEQGV
jgi:hypothetical protein